MLIQYPQRKQIRLKEYDYSSQGYYFITICTHKRKELFGKISNRVLDKNYKNTNVGADDSVRPEELNKNYNIEKIKLSKIGIIIEKTWNSIEKIYDNVQLDSYVVMPNHIHGIIIIKDGGRTGSSAPT